MASSSRLEPADLPGSMASSSQPDPADLPGSMASSSRPEPADLPGSMASSSQPDPADLPGSMASSSRPEPADLPGLKILELSKKPIAGRVLIFNHEEYYSPGWRRKGTAKDVESLKHTFKESLGFKVQVCNDLTFREVDDVITKYAKNMSYKDCASLFVFVLTHGTSNGRLCARNKSYNLSELWGPLKFSEALKGIPKLFFIQACRNSGQRSESDVSGHERRCHTDSLHLMDSADMGTGYWFPHDKDFFFAFSTVEGKFSKRDKVKGTWFIQSVCAHFNHMLNGKGDLLSAMTKVIDEVVIKQDKIGKIITGQTPVFASALDYKICYRHVTDASEDLLVYKIPEEAPGKVYILYEEKYMNEIQSLTSLFETLKFNVMSYLCTSKAYLHRTLRRISTNATDSASIIVVFLTSIGEQTLINFSVTFEECKEPFLASNCKKMIGNPKIFMFLNTEDTADCSSLDGIGLSVPKIGNDHSDMLQLTSYHRDTFDRLMVCLQILSFRRANIIEMLTQVVMGADKSPRGYFLSHFESTLSKAVVLGPSSLDSEEALELLEKLRQSATAFKNTGNHETGKKFRQKIMELLGQYKEVLDIELKETLTTMHNTANTLRESGCYKEALTLFHKCLEKQRHVLGDEHEDTLTTMHNTANTLRESGHYKEALTLFHKCLEKQRHVLGDEHEDTLTTMHNTAFTFRELGRQQEALTLYDNCLEKQIRVLGDDHEETLTTMHNKAFTLGDLGRHKEALSMYNECLEKQRWSLGGEHVNTLNTMHNKANTLRQFGLHENALTLYDECLNKRRCILGDKHENTLSTIHNKAYTLGELLRHKEALTLYEECLEKRHRVVGDEHEHTLSTMHNMAFTLGELGRHKEALSLYDNCLEKQIRVLGDEHVKTMNTMHNKAFTLGKLDFHKEALTLYDECLQKRRHVLGDENKETLATMHQRSVTLKAL